MTAHGQADDRAGFRTEAAVLARAELERHRLHRPADELPGGVHACRGRMRGLPTGPRRRRRRRVTKLLLAGTDLRRRLSRHAGLPKRIRRGGRAELHTRAPAAAGILALSERFGPRANDLSWLAAAIDTTLIVALRARNATTSTGTVSLKLDSDPLGAQLLNDSADALEGSLRGGVS